MRAFALLKYYSYHFRKDAWASAAPHPHRQRPCGGALEPGRSATTSLQPPPPPPAAELIDARCLLYPPPHPPPPLALPCPSTILESCGVPLLSGLPSGACRTSQAAAAARAGAAVRQARSSPAGPAGACSPSTPPSTTSKYLACE